MRTPLLFAPRPRLKEWLFKKPRRRREAIRRRGSVLLPPLFQPPPPPPPPGRQTSAVAPTRPALAGPGHRRRSSDGIRGGYKCQFGPGLAAVSIGSLQSSFALTYLRHSASAQAYYCPDVVGLPPRRTAPFIPGIQ